MRLLEKIYQACGEQNTGRYLIKQAESAFEKLGPIVNRGTASEYLKFRVFYVLTGEGRDRAEHLH